MHCYDDDDDDADVADDDDDDDADDDDCPLIMRQKSSTHSMLVAQRKRDIHISTCNKLITNFRHTKRKETNN